MYRDQDLQFLQDIYDRSSNDIALLYGAKDLGLSELVADLIKDKECLYYRASAVTDATQKQLFAASVHDQTRSPILPDSDYGKLISTYINDHNDRKKIIVLDDFSYLIKENPTFINFLANLLSERCAQGMAMFLLVSSDIKWIEHDMLRLIGKKSSEISGILKLKEFSVPELFELFPDMPLAELIGVYSLTGGSSSYYDMISGDTTFHDLTVKMLQMWDDPEKYPSIFLPADIREPAVYNTILMNIASGVSKLNDMHNSTGIDRAKLSVYLKTLMENSLVEKKVSAAVGDPANTQKGMYRITNRLMLFYFRYIFSHASTLHILGPERFWKRFIEHDLYDFLEECYPLFCMEQIRWLEKEGRLNFKVASIEEYFDKSGAIDFVIVAVGGSVIACSCRYAGPHMSYKTYEDVKASVRCSAITYGCFQLADLTRN